jgi:hypothetical protein
MKNNSHNSHLVKTARHLGIIVILISGVNISVHAQDLLKLITGKELKVTIIEESIDIVKYREFEDPTGPLYSISREKVAEIKYKKGARNKQPDAKVVDNLASTDSVMQKGDSSLLTFKKRAVYVGGKPKNSKYIKMLMEDYPEALTKYESGKKMYSASTTCVFAVLITTFITSGIANGQDNESDKKTILGIGLGIDGVFLLTGIILASKGRQNIRSSIEIYNSSVRKPLTYRLDLGLQDHGIGFALKF